MAVMFWLLLGVVFGVLCGSHAADGDWLLAGYACVIWIDCFVKFLAALRRAL